MLTNRYKTAMQFAATVHDGHQRKGTQVAYLSHLLSVSALVMESGGSEDEAIAALLHDSIEDRGNSYESVFMVEPRNGREALKRDIELQFGAEVLSIVRQCTDDEYLPTGRPSEKGTPEEWRLRKTAYIEALRKKSDVAPLRVSCADLVLRRPRRCVHRAEPAARRRGFAATCPAAGRDGRGDRAAWRCYDRRMTNQGSEQRPKFSIDDVRREERGSSGGRWVGILDGHEAEMTYSRASAVLIIIDHTAVPDALRGRGVGQVLVQRAVEDARREGFKILPLCPFAKGQFERHPEWRDVL